MNDTQINDRQIEILDFLQENSPAFRSEIKTKQGSRITIIRDLNYLVDLNLVEQVGGGRYIKYRINKDNELLIPINLDKYFLNNTDNRKIRYSRFNFEYINNIEKLLSDEEFEIFEQGKAKLLHKFETLDNTIIKRELERFTIELSWKSSQIEGNTYSLLETEELIKNKKESKGHDRNEAIMILNHKKTFDLILEHKESFKKINEVEIRSIHTELTRDLDVNSGIRESAVGITGTKYQPLDNKMQIEEGLDKLVKLVNKLDKIPDKALILLAGISYLQPFVDGNKRTSRMVSNALLLANGYYPLSYRSVDEVEYKKALILFYEQNNIYHLKRLFVEQQKFAIENYFL